MPRPLSTLLLTAALTLVGAASAHAEFVSADPAPGSVLSEAPGAVTLTFSEPVETRFSRLKVYPLEVAEEAVPADPANPSERERQRLNALAAELVSESLEADDDAEARADTGFQGEARTAAVVTLGLKSDLEPGLYVVMWEVLSIDTHWTSGHFLFFLEPGP